MKRMSVFVCLACVFLSVISAQAATVGDALKRPALQVKNPDRTVLLSATQAGNRLVAVGERGIIVLSDDGGQSWRQAACPVSVTLTAVRFADASNGVAVGHGGVALTTTDAGESWALRLDGRKLARLTMDAARDSRNDRDMKEAERLVQDGPDKPFLDVAVFDAAHFLAVGAYGIAFDTKDGGQTWTPWMEKIENQNAKHLYVARVQGDTVLLAGEQGMILRSTDRGVSFKAVASPYKGSWFAGELGSGSEIVLAGMRGNVWRSSNGGGNWVQLTNPIPASVTSIVASNDGLLLANQAGFVLQIRGDVVMPLNETPLSPLTAVVRTGNKLLGFGFSGVVPVSSKSK